MESSRSVGIRPHWAAASCGQLIPLSVPHCDNLCKSYTFSLFSCRAMPILTLNNESVHYELAGDASASVLVFSNSLGTSLSLWESQAEYFSRHFRVLRYDTRGHGQSVKNKGPYSIEQL